MFTKFFLSIFAVVFTAVTAEAAAVNLLPKPVRCHLDCKPHVKFINDAKNDVQKMLIEKYSQDKDGNLCVGASLYFGSAAGDKYGGRGIKAAPGKKYVISFEYTGTVPRFWVAALEYNGTNFWGNRRFMARKFFRITDSKNWKKASFEVLTGPKCQRIGFYTNLYANEKDKSFDYKPGQFLQVRNVSIVEKK